MYENNSAIKQYLNSLFSAQVEAMKKGDFKTVFDINDKMFYAKLDPNDPDYAEKVRQHHKSVRERNAMLQAQKVINATGQSLCFEDHLAAINDAIDRAVESFEHTPCPKHAADLLGLHECRYLLLEANTEEVDESDPEEEDDE